MPTVAGGCLFGLASTPICRGEQWSGAAIVLDCDKGLNSVHIGPSGAVACAVVACAAVAGVAVQDFPIISQVLPLFDSGKITQTNY